MTARARITFRHARIHARQMNPVQALHPQQTREQSGVLRKDLVVPGFPVDRTKVYNQAGLCAQLAQTTRTTEPDLIGREYPLHVEN